MTALLRERSEANRDCYRKHIVIKIKCLYIEARVPCIQHMYAASLLGSRLRWFIFGSTLGTRLEPAFRRSSRVKGFLAILFDSEITRDRWIYPRIPRLGQPASFGITRHYMGVL